MTCELLGVIQIVIRRSFCIMIITFSVELVLSIDEVIFYEPRLTKQKSGLILPV